MKHHNEQKISTAVTATNLALQQLKHIKPFPYITVKNTRKLMSVFTEPRSDPAGHMN